MRRSWTGAHNNAVCSRSLEIHEAATVHAEFSEESVHDFGGRFALLGANDPRNIRRFVLARRGQTVRTAYG